MGNRLQKIRRLSEAQNHRCGYCGVSLSEIYGRDNWWTIDEVVPRCRGGLRVISNQIVACVLCNSGRGHLDAFIYFEAVRRLGRVEAHYWGILQTATKPGTRRRIKQRALAAGSKVAPQKAPLVAMVAPASRKRSLPKMSVEVLKAASARFVDVCPNLARLYDKLATEKALGSEQQ